MNMNTNMIMNMNMNVNMNINTYPNLNTPTHSTPLNLTLPPLLLFFFIFNKSETRVYG